MDANRVRELIATAKATADELETYAGQIAFLAEGYEQRGAELARLEAVATAARDFLIWLDETADMDGGEMREWNAPQAFETAREVAYTLHAALATTGDPREAGRV